MVFVWACDIGGLAAPITWPHHLEISGCMGGIVLLDFLGSIIRPWLYSL